MLRDTHEYILIFSKGTFERKKTEGKQNTINQDQFMEWTKSVWTMNPESAKKIGHPAPFPVELPYRLIQLYTYRGEIVLDPFMGSGSTAIAAIKSERKYIGYEIDAEYVRLAEERIALYTRTKIDKPICRPRDITNPRKGIIAEHESFPKLIPARRVNLLVRLNPGSHVLRVNTDRTLRGPVKSRRCASPLEGTRRGASEIPVPSERGNEEKKNAESLISTFQEKDKR